jgi:hypothetical protein
MRKRWQMNLNRILAREVGVKFGLAGIGLYECIRRLFEECSGEVLIKDINDLVPLLKLSTIDKKRSKRIISFMVLHKIVHTVTENGLFVPSSYQLRPCLCQTEITPREPVLEPTAQDELNQALTDSAGLIDLASSELTTLQKVSSPLKKEKREEKEKNQKKEKREKKKIHPLSSKKQTRPWHEEFLLKCQTKIQDWPDELKTPVVTTELMRWLKYREETGHRYKSIDTIATILKQYAKRPESLIAAIDFSIGEGYQGLFEPRQNNNNQPLKAQREHGPASATNRTIC